MFPISGVKFAHEIRRGENSTNPTVPIIMATAYSAASHVLAARDEGVNDFVFKPLSANSLMTHILRVVEHPRPFIKAVNYFGPDRRRVERPLRGPERRIESPADPDQSDTPNLH